MRKLRHDRYARVRIATIDDAVKAGIYLYT
jgi:hypothetical protein